MATLGIDICATMNPVSMLGIVLYLLPFLGFAATMPPVRMKVVDAQDGSPVAGAHVLFQGNAQEGTFTGHGGRLANLFVTEAVTEESGDFRLPKQDFSSQPFFLNTNYHNPSMVVLKPGYVLLVLTNTLRIIPNLDEVTTWQYDNQTIKMKRVTTENEVLHALTSAAMYAEMPVTEKSICSWKQFPRFLAALDRLIAEWEKKRATAVDSALRDRSVASPLQKIMMNDKLFVEKACGSPKAFFEFYRR
jgi:hypothetical protein